MSESRTNQDATSLSLWDRIGRSLFVALAVGLAWGIRGDFGHSIGAMYPGAALGLAFAWVSGQRSLHRWMPIVAALSAMGIGSGGTMSYGLLHGYAQSDTFLNYSYGFLTLFLQGSAWGTFGGALIGLMLERQPLRTSEWLGLLGSLFVGGWLVSLVVVNFLGFQINPPRNNISVAFMGAALGQLIWLAYNNKSIGLRGAVLGYLGFGLGMAGGRLLGNLANVFQGVYNYSINHWNVMEVSCGMIGGFIFTFGMVNRVYPDPPKEPNIKLSSFYGILTVLGFLPLWHRLARIIPEEKLPAWSATLATEGWERPELLAQTVLGLIDGVCVLGFVGVALWSYLHFRGNQRWPAFPILWLSLTMLLFQNLNALYFFKAPQPNTINMHNVFWALMALMTIYVLVVRPRPAAQRRLDPEDGSNRVPWLAWVSTGVIGMTLILILATWINGETTMASASTRWPNWSWRDGPFPGR
ncbi:hypothetical protein [Tautonia marina]|uniref:hypothetical protein n=1 Tax=Tautonia marina TaxID=2653855 RepID=UPI001260A94C|nr:hypothetical protein [Tautonia marina]